jgi:ribosomal protein S18 acetylase RimI-like enzyme
MDRTRTLHLFDRSMRLDPPPEDGYRSVWVGPVLRRIGPHNYVEYSELDSASAPRAVAEAVEFVRASGQPLEWKVYEHDAPGELGALLANAGFVADPAEVLVAFDLEGRLEAPPVSGVEIRRVTDAQGLEDAVSVGRQAFDEDGVQIRERLAGRLGSDDMALFVAYLDGGPVSAGRLELPPGRPFASLWGGGTSPDFRGRGIYRNLVAARAKFASERGYRYLTVDARDSTSRPILERMGFVALAGVVGWVLEPPGTPHPPSG